MNMDFFFNRKTIRKYKSEAIPSDTIERMLDAAAQSPTTGGMQLYSVVITTDTDIKEELAKSHFNQPAATGAPMLLTFCADFNRFIKWCELSDAATSARQHTMPHKLPKRLIFHNTLSLS